MTKSFRLSEDQLERYARHIALEGIGRSGQKQLLKSKVLVIGAGGLGAPVILYLAAAGIGTIGVIDFDTVTLSNLQRQVLYQTSDIGKNKVDCVREAVININHDVSIISYNKRLTKHNAIEMLQNYDIIADCTDNFETRFLINDACYFAEKPLAFASISGFKGHLTTFKGYEDKQPCYRCLFGNPPPKGGIPSAAQIGIMGVSAGIMGTMQANEIIKELLGLGESLAGNLVIYDGLKSSFHKAKALHDKGCPLCGQTPSIKSI
jgi:adenylyltransferase/sulfurtransferase